MIKKILAVATLVAAGILGVHPALAGLIVSYSQVGNDVVATASGSMNLTGLTQVTSASVLNKAFLYGPNSAFGFGDGAPGSFLGYTGFTTLPNFQTGSGFVFADSASGDSLSLNPIISGPNNGFIFLSSSYVSQSQFSSSAVFNSHTIADLGLIMGTFTYLWASDEVQVVVGAPAPQPVPEPVTIAMFAAGLVGAGVMRARGKQARRVARAA